MKFESCDSISSIIEYGKSLDISHSKLYLKSKIQKPNGNKIIFNSISFGSKYLPLILKHCSDTTLSESDHVKYRYKPKFYCYDHYGTVELWSLLLKVNSMVSTTEFNKRTIKTFGPKIMDVINEILIIESDNINKNINNLRK